MDFQRGLNGEQLADETLVRREETTIATGQIHGSPFHQHVRGFLPGRNEGVNINETKANTGFEHPPLFLSTPKELTIEDNAIAMTLVGASYIIAIAVIHFLHRSKRRRHDKTSWIFSHWEFPCTAKSRSLKLKTTLDKTKPRTMWMRGPQSNQVRNRKTQFLSARQIQEIKSLELNLFSSKEKKSDLTNFVFPDAICGKGHRSEEKKGRDCVPVARWGLWPWKISLFSSHKKSDGSTTMPLSSESSLEASAPPSEIDILPVLIKEFLPTPFAACWDVDNDETPPKQQIPKRGGVHSLLMCHSPYIMMVPDDEDKKPERGLTPRIVHKRKDVTVGSDTRSSFGDSINYSELEMKKVIGEGGFGKVWEANWRGTPVAVKAAPQSSSPKNSEHQRILKEFMAEINILKVRTLVRPFWQKLCDSPNDPNK